MQVVPALAGQPEMNETYFLLAEVYPRECGLKERNRLQSSPVSVPVAGAHGGTYFSGMPEAVRR